MLKKLRTPDKIYVDSSFFVATQITNHPHHKRACKLVELCKKCRFFYSLLTIDEIVYTLSKFDISKNEIAAIVSEKICAIKNTKLITYKAGMKNLEEYVSLWAGTSLEPRDAMHAYFMKSQKIECIATFDHDFRKHQKKLGIKVLTKRIAKG